MSEKKTLTQIVQDHQSLDELMIETGGEISESEQETIVDSWLLEIWESLETKADGYKYRMDSLETASERLRERAKLMSSAAKVLDNMSAYLKDRMKSAMLTMQMPEIQGKDFRFKISASKPAVEIEEKLLPAEYMREKITFEPNKDVIKKALDAGTEVPGAKLQVRYSIRVLANKVLELK